MQVDHAIIHKLVKQQHGKAQVVERATDLPVTPAVEKLVTDIHDLYSGRASKGYGRFEADELNYPTATVLRAVFKDKTKTFADASKQLLAVLAAKATSVPLATGGYVLMAHLTNEQKSSWFLTAILTNVDGSAIDDKTLEVIDAVHVDLENLRVAGRVNLNEWLKGDPDIRYVGFLKQRGEVADYFKQFLGCNELIADTEETKKLVKSLKEFAKAEGLGQEEETAFLQKAFEYCSERTKKREALHLEALSNAVWPSNPKKLQKSFVSNDVQITDGFVPDGRITKSLMRLKAKTEYWSVDIDRHALQEGYATYNPNKGELTLKKLPADLRAELDRELSGGD